MVCSPAGGRQSLKVHENTHVNVIENFLATHRGGQERGAVQVHMRHFLRILLVIPLLDAASVLGSTWGALLSFPPAPTCASKNNILSNTLKNISARFTTAAGHDIPQQMQRAHAQIVLFRL